MIVIIHVYIPHQSLGLKALILSLPSMAFVLFTFGLALFVHAPVAAATAILKPRFTFVLTMLGHNLNVI